MSCTKRANVENDGTLFFDRRAVKIKDVHINVQGNDTSPLNSSSRYTDNRKMPVSAEIKQRIEALEALAIQ